MMDYPIPVDRGHFQATNGGFYKILAHLQPWKALKMLKTRGDRFVPGQLQRQPHV
jgi:hypothetical protein